MNTTPSGLSTNECAALVKRKPQTLRKRYAMHGHYFGVRPTKLANGSLLWPEDALVQLMGGLQ